MHVIEPCFQNSRKNQTIFFIFLPINGPISVILARDASTTSNNAIAVTFYIPASQNYRLMGVRQGQPREAFSNIFEKNSTQLRHIFRTG